MKTKIFTDRNITIKPFSNKDLKCPKKFQVFINSLIKENAQIILNKELSLKEEKEFLKSTFEQIKRHQQVFLVARCKNDIIGTTGISLRKGRQNHIGEFGITIRKNYRRIGLGSYLMKEIIKLAKKQLKPQPKIIRLNVFPTNKPAIELYKKQGFRKAAKIPLQIEYQGKLIKEVIMLLYL